MNRMFCLKILFTAILVAMLLVTYTAASQQSLFAAGYLLKEPWMVAALWDAYCGFITFYVWVAYKETKWLWRIVWFVLIMCLGNIAMAVYLLLQLFRLPDDAKIKDLLLRKAAAQT